MSRLKSVISNRFRQSFLSAYALSCLVPLLILVYLVFQYIYPLLNDQQTEQLQDVFTIGLIIMLTVPILGFFLLSWWLKSLENLTSEVKTKSAAVIKGKPGASSETDSENEMVTLRVHFDQLYNELQDKIGQLNVYSNRLIDTNIILAEQAVTDPLTTLYNRRYFDERVKEEASRAQRHHLDLTMIMLDVDDFKAYNDTYGHPAGDELLQNLALLIRTSIRKSDIPFRYGGDEFAVLLPQCSVRDATAIARKLVRAVTVQRFGGQKEGSPENVSISCGVAGFTGDKERFLKDSDRCLYLAKSAGKSKVVYKGALETSPTDQ